MFAGPVCLDNCEEGWHRNMPGGPEQILHAFFGQFGYPPDAASDWGTTTSKTIFLVNPTAAVTSSA